VALGGVAESNLREVSESGAGGVAGISLFAGGQNLAATLHLIEGLWTRRGGEVKGRP
jgi:thiamine monophosphate synthase